MYKIEVLEYIRNVSNYVSNNRIQSIEENTIDEEIEEIEQVQKIDESVIKELFEKYDFEYDKMPNELKEALQTKCNLSKLISVFETRFYLRKVSVICIHLTCW